MGTHERYFRPTAPLRTSVHPHLVLDSDLARPKVQRGCGAVARKRARRYLARRRLPKALWPMIAAVILVVIAFDRQIEPALARKFSHSRRAERKARPAGNGRDEEAYALPSETGAALNGEAALRYRPSADFQSKHAAQMIAFLIRNRGKLDNEVVREKWKHLDRNSIPLAVYLRDVESHDEWSTLEREILTCPFPSKSATGPTVSFSVRHWRISELMPEWIRRGEKLLTWLETDEPAPTESSEHRPDDDDTDPAPTPQ